MPTASDVAATVGRKMAALERSTTNKVALIRSVKASKTTMERSARPDFGGDMALSNWRRGRPVKVRIRDDIVSEREAKITPRPIGPMKVMESGRRAGVSTRRRSRGRAYGSSRGKGTWTKARKDGQRDAVKVYRKEQVREIVQAFKA